MIFETICALALLARLIPGCAAPSPIAVGYVEGEYVQLGPIDVARIISLDVKRGDHINQGATVASTEQADAELSVRDAQARLMQAESDLSNLRRGRRSEEIAVIEATLVAAKAQAGDARRTLERRKDLAKRGFTTPAELDAAQTAVDVADARIGELSANLDVARLPARPDEISAAQGRVDQARANLDTSRWRFAQRIIIAPAKGRVSDIIRRPGEVAGPSAPIVSFLPDGAIKLKVYVPERTLSQIHNGTRLAVRCDGCASNLSAVVTYVAPEPEFTPPVIYSLDTRQKLVFLIEARPESATAAALQPGQIVDVAIAESK